MKTIQFPKSGGFDPFVYAILRYIDMRPGDPSRRKEIQAGMRLVWLISPDEGEGLEEFKQAMRRAKRDFIQEVRGPGGGFSLTRRGRAFLEWARASGRYDDCPALWRAEHHSRRPDDLAGPSALAA